MNQQQRLHVVVTGEKVRMSQLSVLIFAFIQVHQDCVILSTVVENQAQKNNGNDDFAIATAVSKICVPY